MADQNIYDLFKGTLDVTNEALEKNRDSKVIGTLFAAADKPLSGHKAGVEIYDEDPDKPFDYFTVRYLDGKIELYARGKSEHDTEWKVSKNYLQSVVDDPQKYIDNPTKLNFEWLKVRLPDSARSLLDKAS